MKFSKSKKKIVGILTATVISVSFISCGQSSEESKKNNSEVAIVSPKGTDITADEAIELLKDGNKRYVDGKLRKQDISNDRREDLLENGQYPYAVIVSCSDSRVPAELVFDEGLGNVFVIRNAGNVIDQVTLGSVEYGAEHLGTPLIVVLGHQNCGAVKATVDGGEASENIEAIKDLIKPSYEEATKETTHTNKVCSVTEDLNIKNSIEAIKESEVIKELLNENKVKIVGAKYSLEDGKVTFMD